MSEQDCLIGQGDGVPFKAVVVAGGSGARMKKTLPKQFWKFSGKTILEWSIDKFNESEKCDRIVIVLPEQWREKGKKVLSRYDFKKDVVFALGGARREDSVLSALECLENNDLVAIHDAARPFLSEKLLTRLYENAKKKGSAVPVITARDTVIYKKIKKKSPQTETIIQTLIQNVSYTVNRTKITYLDRNNLYMIQTPQFFNVGILTESIRKAKEAFSADSTFVPTDDSGMVKNAGFQVSYIRGSTDNLKLTYPKDLAFFRFFAESLAGKKK
ncbi:MAG: 2-C-methyl-D-erythritol 4-phosphate cytidylyltransferase [Candidatus Riflebacteria bacterium]|nr:2-C-methyl-D-erythritol 4-phosphate cytidylyltransferase [Candidatus Riflebacteria bacterium]